MRKNNIMDIELLVKIAGILGFVFSVAVFLLTRWERRKRVVIELEIGDASRFLQPGEEVIGEGEDVVVIRVVNIEELKPFMNDKQYKKTIIPVFAEFRELNGRRFLSKGYSYFFYVGAIIGPNN